MAKWSASARIRIHRMYYFARKLFSFGHDKHIAMLSDTSRKLWSDGFQS